MLATDNAFAAMHPVSVFTVISLATDPPSLTCSRYTEPLVQAMTCKTPHEHIAAHAVVLSLPHMLRSTKRMAETQMRSSTPQSQLFSH